MRRTLALLVPCVSVLAAGGCGSGQEEGSPTTTTQASTVTVQETTTTAAKTEGAAAEIVQIKAMLRQALATYRRGDRAGAERIVGDAYLEHFEKVEHPLEERDRELMEELEVLISTTIRNAMKRGAPVAEVESLIAEAERGLDRAAVLLR